MKVFESVLNATPITIEREEFEASAHFSVNGKRLAVAPPNQTLAALLANPVAAQALRDELAFISGATPTAVTEALEASV